MDLEDSFTRKLLARTQARREEVNRNVGVISSGTPSSVKRRRTPLAEENISSDDSNDGNLLEVSSDSPKRQCFESSFSSAYEETPNETPEPTPEPSPRNSDNKENSPAALPVLGVRGLAAIKRKDRSGPCSEAAVPNFYNKHEEAQGFTKSPSAARITYSYPEGEENAVTSSIRDRVKAFEKTKHEEIPKTPASVKKMPITQSSTPATISPYNAKPPAVVSHDESSRDVDPAKLSVAARKALFEAPLAAGAQIDEENPETLTVSQRTALFERAMTPGGSSARSSFRGRSPARKEPPKEVAPSSPVVPQIPVPVNQNGIPKPPPSPGILRKINPLSTNATAPKVVRFSPDSPLPVPATVLAPPVSPGKTLGAHTQELQQRLLGQVQGGNTSCSRLAQKTIAERRKEMEMLLFNKRSVPEEEESFSTQFEEVSVQNLPTQEDISNESKDITSELECDFEEECPSIEAATPVDERRNRQPSYSTEAQSVCREMDQMLDEAMDSESTDESLEMPEISAMSSIRLPSPRKVYTNPISGTREEEEISLVHSVSVYRRQKQALCTPPVRVIQRKPIRESPPSPVLPEEDPQNMEELHAKIQHLQESLHCQEVQVRQACQALVLCAAKPEFFGSMEHIEGERLLLIASHKRNAYRSTLERLKTEAALGVGKGSVQKAMGSLTMSDIRLPLRQEFLSSLVSGTSDGALHFFLCLIRYREKVIATEMLSTRGGITAGTFCFSNHICIQELQNNFSILFEVYALQTSEENVSHERKYSIKKDYGKGKAKKHESKSKLSPALSSPIGAQVKERLSNFGMVGFIQLTVDNCNKKVLALEKVPGCSPLDGRVYMKAQLCTQQPIKEQGFLTMFEDVSGFGAWHRRWFVLSGSHLSYWKYPDQVQNEVPTGSIDLRTCITPEVGLVSADVCARKNTFMLFCMRQQNRGDQNNLIVHSMQNKQVTTKNLLSADTREERLLWCKQLNAALEVIRKWDPRALKPTDYPF